MRTHRSGDDRLEGAARWSWLQRVGSITSPPPSSRCRDPDTDRPKPLPILPPLSSGRLTSREGGSEVMKEGKAPVVGDWVGERPRLGTSSLSGGGGARLGSRLWSLQRSGEIWALRCIGEIDSVGGSGSPIRLPRHKAVLFRFCSLKSSGFENVSIWCEKSTPSDRILDSASLFVRQEGGNCMHREQRGI